MSNINDNSVFVCVRTSINHATVTSAEHLRMKTSYAVEMYLRSQSSPLVKKTWKSEHLTFGQCHAVYVYLLHRCIPVVLLCSTI